VTNGKLSADRRNPYVYAHPGRDVVRLGERLDTLAGFSKEGHSMTIEVAVPDPWPIPWYLRRFDRDHVGYWETPDTLPPQLNAPIILTCGDMSGPAEKKINGSYHVEYFGLRPNEIVAVHVRTDLWDAYLKSRVNIRRTPA
jgi:predicted membrane-bound mannosyltransferase